VALDTFVDNCALLAIESCLLNDIQLFFHPDAAWEMDAEEVATITAEPHAERSERIKTTSQKETLENVLRTCRKYARTVTSK
jgi:hypothetical protein